MHCELVVPSLFASPAKLRLPALELLLARGRASHAGAESLEQWLAQAFDVDAPLPAGVLTALGDGAEPGERRWARADPVHLRLMRDHLILVPSAAFSISRAEADSFCEVLNRHFSGTLTLHPLRPERWCATLDEEWDITAPAPLDMAGRDVNTGLSRGTNAGRLQAIANEAQMLLHAHPLNEAREARGEPTVNSVWLWGSGSAPRVPAEQWHTVFADEPIALGLARLAGARQRALPATADALLERAPEDGRHLVVLDSLRAPSALSHSAEYHERLQALERQWFAPLLAALRAGRIGMVSVHIPETGASFETIRGDLRRFWRRPKAIGRYA
jgi:hypothetical protein